MTENASWPITGGAPGGGNGDVQVNVANALAGYSNFTYDGTNLSVANAYVPQAGFIGFDSLGASPNWSMSLDPSPAPFGTRNIFGDVLYICYDGSSQGQGIAFGNQTNGSTLELDGDCNVYMIANTFFGNAIYALGGNESLDFNHRQLFDPSGIQSEDYGNRILSDGFPASSLDWANRLLIDSGGSTTSLDWNNRVLNDSNAEPSIDWQNRHLTDSFVTTVLDWQNYRLNDTAQDISIQFDIRRLYDESGTIAIDYSTNRVLRDPYNFISVDWNNRYLVEGAGNTTVDFNNRFLYDSTNFETIDWENKNLLTSSGLSVDWFNRLLADSSSISSMDWQNRKLLDSNSVVAIEWQNGIRTLVDGSNVVVMDFLNRQLYDASGHVDLNFRDRVAADASGVTCFDWGNRTLKDTVGTTQVSWGGTSGPTISNAIKSYNGNTTAGNGVASVVSSVDLTAQTSSIGSTTLFTTTSAGLFQVSVYLYVTTNGTSGTVACTIGWTDPTTTRTNSPAAIVTFGAANFSQGSVVIKTTSASNITYTTTVTSPIGTPKYGLVIGVTRLS